MKAIILAGGFAKRMYPVTKEFPKPLLEVGGKKVMGQVIESIETVRGVDEILISTNKRFESYFRFFLDTHKYQKKVRLIVEETTSNKDKLGAVKALAKVVDDFGINEAVLVITGDNFFQPDLKGLIGFFKEKKSIVFMTHDIKDKSLVRRKYGVVECGSGGEIVGFEEKPEYPKTSMISTGCYLFPSQSLYLLNQYLLQTNRKDSLGNLIAWLIKEHSVYGFEHKGYWYDIGSLEVLEEINLDGDKNVEK